jgi:hypothetical protein
MVKGLSLLDFRKTMNNVENNRWKREEIEENIERREGIFIQWLNETITHSSLFILLT